MQLDPPVNATVMCSCCRQQAAEVKSRLKWDWICWRCYRALLIQCFNINALKLVPGYM